jgi:hypothetical protein
MVKQVHIRGDGGILNRMTFRHSLLVIIGCVAAKAACVVSIKITTGKERPSFKPDDKTEITCVRLDTRHDWCMVHGGAWGLESARIKVFVGPIVSRSGWCTRLCRMEGRHTSSRARP